MPTLSELQAEWNSLVPAAQVAGIRGVRPLRSVHESVAIGTRRVQWLRDRLGVSTSHTPVQDIGDLTFGVELEVLLPRGMDHHGLAALVAAAGVPCRFLGYTHAVTAEWKVVTDASVPGGAELVSPILRGDAGLEQLRVVCRALTAANVKVDRRCGFHVHVGVAGESLDTLKRLVTNFAHFETVMDQLVSASRRNNQYCRPVVVGQSQRAASPWQLAGLVNYGGRYSKLNVAAYLRHGTVEFRQHQGTIDAQKAVEWVRLCLGMVRAARGTGNREPATLGGLMQHIGAGEASCRFFETRARQLAAPRSRRAA